MPGITRGQNAMDFETYVAHTWAQQAPGVWRNEHGDVCEVDDFVMAQHQRHALAVLEEAERQSVRSEARRILERKTAPSFEFHGARDEIDEADNEEVTWLVDRILPSDAFVLVTAQAKTGKTTFMLNLLQSLLKGSPFLGLATAPSYARNVLYLNADMARGIFRRSFLAPLDFDNRMICLHTHGLLFDSANAAHTRALADQCAEREIGVVVVDVWGAAFSGDENDNSEVRHAADNLAAMKSKAELDAIVVIHHAGWGGLRARGASSLEGAVDVLWRMENQDGRRIFSSTGRIEDYGPVELGYNRGQGSVFVAATGAGSDEETIGKALELIVVRPGIGANELRSALLVSKERAQSAVQALLDRNRIEAKWANGKRGYYVAPEP